MLGCGLKHVLNALDAVFGPIPFVGYYPRLLWVALVAKRFHDPERVAGVVTTCVKVDPETGASIITLGYPGRH